LSSIIGFLCVSQEVFKGSDVFFLYHRSNFERLQRYKKGMYQARTIARVSLDHIPAARAGG